MFSKGLLPVLAMQFVLIACTVNSSPVDIGGIQYCVPRENFIDAPPWTPQEMPSDGFAFSWLASTGKKGFDTAAQFDVSGVVSDAKRFAWWSHPKQDHFYRRVAENSMAVREAQGNQLFVFENSDRKRAYIWKLARASGDGATPIADDDELLALCESEGGAAFGPKPAYGAGVCRRAMVNKAFSSLYRVKVARLEEAVFRNYDQQVASLIGEWACK